MIQSPIVGLVDNVCTFDRSLYVQF